MKKVICVLTFLVFFIVILANLKIIFFEKDFYFDEHKKFDTQNKLYTDNLQIKKVTYETVSYLAYGDGFLDNTLNEEPFLTKQEKNHMNDVRRLTQSGLALFKVCLVLFVIVASFYVSNAKVMGNTFFYSGIIIVLFGIVMYLLSLLNFSSVFEIFHNIFFSGNYTFSLDSKMIIMFPIQFFYDAFTIVLIRSGLAGIGLAMLGYSMR